MNHSRLLLACARAELSAANAQEIRALCSDPTLDWDRAIEEAVRHRMLFLLSAHLRKACAELPDELRSRLARYELQNTQRVLRLAAELLALLRDLQAAGVAAVPYKGPALAQQLYGSVCLRHAGDIDILVSRQSAATARLRLFDLGYEPLNPVPDHAVSFMLRERYSETLRRGDIVVELHWAFTNNDVALPLDLADLAPRFGTIRIGSSEVKVLDPSDLVLILAVHGAKHRWDRLEWLCGLAEAVRACPPRAVDEALQRAARLGVRRMLLLGLLLVHDLLGARVRAELIAEARRDRVVRDTAEQVPVIWESPLIAPGANSLPVDQFRYRLRERWRDRARFACYRITTPSRASQWRFLRLGRHTVPVHGVLRPIRLGASAAAAGIAGLLRRVARPG